MFRLFGDQKGSSTVLAIAATGLLAGVALVNQSQQLGQMQLYAAQAAQRSNAEAVAHSAFSLLQVKICADHDLVWSDNNFEAKGIFKVKDNNLLFDVAVLDNSDSFDHVFTQGSSQFTMKPSTVTIESNHFPETMDLAIETPVGDSSIKTRARVDCTANLYDKALAKHQEMTSGTPAEESFVYGTPDPMVDYLFIVDNSISVNKLINNVYKGFIDVLNSRDAFSNDSMVAVMTTGVAKLDDLTMRHATYGGRPFNKSGLDVRDEPGFLDFVDGKAIEDYKTKYADNKRVQQYYQLEGCDNKWFRPYEKNDQGQYCLRAALQSTLEVVGAEAGITAFEQLLVKNAGRRLFRKGAYVNVIFVSDTHDPGLKSQELLDNIKSYDELLTLARTNNQISGLRFHAMAPQKSRECASESFSEQTYFKLAQDSGGTVFNVCNEPQYGPVFKSLISNSKEAVAEFPLTFQPRKIAQILVGDKSLDLGNLVIASVNDSETQNDTGDENDRIEVDTQGVVTIPNLDPKEAVNITVKYFY